jgi:hypothetical protein
MEEVQNRNQNNSNQFVYQQNVNDGVVKNKKISVSKFKWIFLYLLTIPIGFLLSIILFFMILKFMSTGEGGYEDSIGPYIVAFPIFWASLPIFILSGVALLSKLKNGIVTKKVKVLIAITAILAVLIPIAFWAYIFLGLW